MSISGEKDALRAQLRARLSQSDPAENAACDVRITLQVLSLPAFQAAERIFAYCSVVPEVDTHAILAQARRRGKTVALPVTQPDGQMRFARFDGALVPGRFGIPEPPRSARTLLPQPGDLMLVPALAYDRAGRRLGRGGGYYDRFLARVDCCTVGLIRAAFLLDALPAKWNDVPVSAVITEDGVLRPQENRGSWRSPDRCQAVSSRSRSRCYCCCRSRSCPSRRSRRAGSE